MCFFKGAGFSTVFGGAFCVARSVAAARGENADILEKSTN